MDHSSSNLGLYLVTRTDRIGYDQYDSFVICCKSEYEAKRTHPYEVYFYDESERKWYTPSKNIIGEREYDDPRVWINGNFIDYLNVKFIGKADSTIKEGEIIISSFNAG